MNGFQDAFISYGRADSKAFALKLYQHLRDYGLKVWFDFENIPLGVDFQHQHLPTSFQNEFIRESLRQPPATSLNVFISYSRVDSDFVHKLNEALQMQGKTTWFDQESIPADADFQQEIYQGIEASDNFLVVLSPRSINSPYCADEVEYAASLNKRIVTVLHQAVNPADLHPELAKIQWIDFSQNEIDFATNFSQLVRTLDTDREHVSSHTKWSQRALEWQEKGNSQDLLLRGSEFAVAQNWLQTALEQNKQPAPTALQQTFIQESKQAKPVMIKPSNCGIETAPFSRSCQGIKIRLAEWRSVLMGKLLPPPVTIKPLNCGNQTALCWQPWLGIGIR